MAAGIERRRFLQMGMTGIAALALGTQAGRVADLVGGTATAAPRVLELTIGEAMVEMVDLTPVYMWTFADENGPRVPGPVLHALEGDTIELSVVNTLDEQHAFAVLGTGIATPPIPPGGSAQLSFTAPTAGTYLYLDPLSAPVNRLLGLHGMMVVLPRSGNTPYSSPTPALQQLFDDLGDSEHFPGEPWRVERTRLWHLHTVDPRWHAKAQAGEPIDPAQMASGYLARYFTLNGQSGFFASHNPECAPVGRIGQPHLIRIANTGMVANSLHIHGNHVYMLAENGLAWSNIPMVDSWKVGPLDRSDWLLPFMRPPDISGPESRPLGKLLAQELNYRDDYGLRQSPLEYPMHCHMEPSQTAAGGNYPGGLVTHWAITGDLSGPSFPGSITDLRAAMEVNRRHASHAH